MAIVNKLVKPNLPPAGGKAHFVKACISGQSSGHRFWAKFAVVGSPAHGPDKVLGRFEPRRRPDEWGRGEGAVLASRWWLSLSSPCFAMLEAR
jgi:hypothetical protein